METKPGVKLWNIWRVDPDPVAPSSGLIAQVGAVALCERHKPRLATVIASYGEQHYQALETKLPVLVGCWICAEETQPRTPTIDNDTRKA